MATTKVGTSGIKDDAVTEAKLANAINAAVAANTAKDLTALSASNLTSGTIPDARFPATLPAASAANLTAVPAANITGTLPAISGANLTDLPAGGQAKNIAINGAMTVSQRGTVTGIQNNASKYGGPDRFKTTVVNHGVYTSSQQTDAPAGFTHSLKVDNTSQVSSEASNARLYVQHKIEKQDLTHLKKGTSGALQITVQFWVKSNKTGTYILELWDNINNRHVSATYTISSSATWEKKTLTFPADTGGNAYDGSNGTSGGIDFNWWLAAGSNFTSGSLASTWSGNDDTKRVVGITVNVGNSGYWQLSGVQIEAGDSASDFAYEPYPETLRKCQRYYWKIALNTARRVNGYKRHDGNSFWELQCPVPMRTGPSPTLLNSGTFTNFTSNFNTTQSGPHVNEWNQDTGWGLLYVSSNWSSTSVAIPSWEGYSIEFDAEL